MPAHISDLDSPRDLRDHNEIIDANGRVCDVYFDVHRGEYLYEPKEES